MHIPIPPIRIHSQGLLSDLSIIHNCITLHLVVVDFNLSNKRLDQVMPRSLLDLGFFLAFCGRLKDSGLVSLPQEPGESMTANLGAGRKGCHHAGLCKAKSKALLGPGCLPFWGSQRHTWVPAQGQMAAHKAEVSSLQPDSPLAMSGYFGHSLSELKWQQNKCKMERRLVFVLM